MRVERGVARSGGNLAIMAKKVSLVNMKGGVGKTTIAVNLAFHFGSWRGGSAQIKLLFSAHPDPRLDPSLHVPGQRKRVLLIDLDPQFNASQYVLGSHEYGKLIEDDRPTICDLFRHSTPAPGAEERMPSDPGGLIVRMEGLVDLVPSRLELARSMGDPHQEQYALAELIAQVEGDYDLVIVDCPPTESSLTRAAYLASEYILVPVKPEYLSTIGLGLLVRSMDEFRQRHPEHPLELAGVVFNAAEDYLPEEERAKSDVKRMAEVHGWHVFQNEIYYSRSYAKGAREGRPISRTSHARRDRKQNFVLFAEEFASRIGL